MNIIGVIFIRIAEFLNDVAPTYVDISIGEKIDEERFINMYTIIHLTRSNEGYEFKDRIIEKVRTYFNELLDAIRMSNNEKLEYLSKYIHEAKFTNLGYSKSGGSSGKGFGKAKFENLVRSIKKSEAYKSGTISDILDIELYADKIGPDLISDLITNLIQDVLSEYTEKKVLDLNMGHNLVKYSKMHFWDETTRKWAEREMPVIYYTSSPEYERYNYLLVPDTFTSDDRQKDRIVQKIFDECVYWIFNKKIFSDEMKYGNYIHEFKNGKRVIFKISVSKFINHEIGPGLAKKGHGYITGKGLLNLVENYSEIKEFIETKIKK